MSARILPGAAALLLLAGATRDDPLAGRVAGTPVNCIELTTTTGPEIVDNRTILYRQGGRIWRTGPRGTCNALRRGETLITTIYGSRLCRNDRFRLLTPGTVIPSNFCLFDQFTPYDRAK